MATVVTAATPSALSGGFVCRGGIAIDSYGTLSYAMRTRCACRAALVHMSSRRAISSNDWTSETKVPIIPFKQLLVLYRRTRMLLSSGEHVHLNRQQACYVHSAIACPLVYIRNVMYIQGKTQMSLPAIALRVERYGGTKDGDFLVQVYLTPQAFLLVKCETAQQMKYC
jgi:hypothetical protein